MKGEITRRYMHESPKVGIRRGTDTVSSQWNAEVKPGRRSAMNRPYGESMEAGGAHEVGLSSIEQRPLTQTKAKDGDSGRAIESLHKNGRVNELVEKQDGSRKEGIGPTKSPDKERRKHAVGKKRRSREGGKWEK